MHAWPDAEPDLNQPPAGTVRCWRIPIAAMGEAMPHAAALLDAAERQRLERFRRPEDRQRFVAAHAGLRILLAAALVRDTSEVAYRSGTHGKPALIDDGLHFNLSHSGAVALIALAADVPLGVDVEALRPLPERDDIVARYFHPAEAAELALLGDGETEQAFYRTWTRKEALTKAIGLGLNLELHRFRVSCRTGADPAVLALEGFEPPPSGWSIADLDPAPGHVGAVAFPSRVMKLECRTLNIAAWLRVRENVV